MVMEECCSSSSILDSDAASQRTFELPSSSDTIHIDEDLKNAVVDGVPIITCMFCNIDFLSLEVLAEHIRLHTVPDDVQDESEDTDIVTVEPRYL